ncbi:oligopeptidase A [Candidatus Pantoea edessiphila]|uniref:oligopeptidase A n=1 Tax=Candidatus Pantoea edessiphila TaxID=2044610 RepID=A0A2P5SXJ8_9GAMM|nr:oligopeptidase A [Candidatus Pantoea edessiphila]MBK4775712.1 oligopeptidase A [Pantoea sp. Edef]PPI87059.1 oligopeptidase A [Candidatus Pantoea edessiphila]
MINPLLTSFTLPPFSKIKLEHIIPAIIEVLKDCKLTVEKISSQKIHYSWNNVVKPIDEQHDRLNRIFSPISHLNLVKNNTELRKIYEQAYLLILQYYNWEKQNKNLYQAYVYLQQQDQYILLNTSQKKHLDNIINEFKLSGIDLGEDKQKRYREIIDRLSQLELVYNNNVLDSTMNWKKLITNKKQLSGINQNILFSIYQNSKNYNNESWLLTLDFPVYSSVITYCNNDQLREEMYLAYSTRASDQGPNAHKWDNTNIINEQLSLRYELAQLLDFKSFADKALVKESSKNPQKVLIFLDTLLSAIDTKVKKEISQLEQFVKTRYNINKLNAWDIAYYSQKQKQYLYNFNDEQLRPYFPETRVLSGLFELANRIFGISIINYPQIDSYHKDVKFFNVFNNKGELLGGFYIDLYARKNKCSGAWMDICTNRMRKKNGKIQKPISYIVCNFTDLNQNKPAIFTHNEVITLLHEFGHCLHHILTSIEIPAISGTNGIPLDIIEFPSQFMENWCWESDFLSLISGHYETNEPISSEIIKKILQSKNYQIGLFILRQIEFSLFDLTIHYEFHPQKNKDILNILNKIRKNIAVFPYLKQDRFPHAFNHIFSGCYAARYYSYLWANVLACDAYSVFKKNGIFDQKTGKLFLENILKLGGSEDFMNMFQRFLGRAPNINALLQQYGINVFNNKNKHT